VAQVIFAQIRLPLFSVKHPEAFQVMSSLSLPQPSSLVGALAYCIGVSSGKGIKAYSEVLEMVRKGELLAARARLFSTYTETRGEYPLTYSAVVLRRFRIVDKAHETKKRGEVKPIVRLNKAISEKNYVEARRILEVELTDAFYREYTMGFEIICAWIFKKNVVDPKVLWLIQRLGDTESLCSVVKVWSEECPIEVSTDVSTSFLAPADGLVSVKGRGFMLMKISDEARKIRTFVVPCEYSVEKGPRGKYPVMRPSIVELKYSSGVSFCKTKYGDIVLGMVKGGRV